MILWDKGGGERTVLIATRTFKLLENAGHAGGGNEGERDVKKKWTA